MPLARSIYYLPVADFLIGGVNAGDASRGGYGVMIDHLKITVVICTHDRFEDLVYALDGLAKQDLPQSQFEVLIVDNSLDVEKRERFFRQATLAANVRVVSSSPPGLSRARNVALAEATTPLVAFLDDDAIPSPAWLEELLSCASKYPSAAIIAGPIDPLWAVQRPEWLPDTPHQGALTILDLGEEDCLLVKGGGYGANLTVRTGPVREVGGFLESLGRAGTISLLSGEEMELQDRLRSAGFEIAYAAAARVQHRIHSGRQSRNYLRGRFAWEAVSNALTPGGYPYLDWSRKELVRSTRVLGIESLTPKLLGNLSGEEFAAQLDVVRHLLAILLCDHNKPDEASLDAYFEGSINSPEAPEVWHDGYRPQAALPPDADHIFVDGCGHEFLFDVFGEIEGTTHIKLDSNLWSAFDSTMDYISASLPTHARSLTFMTLDPCMLGVEKSKKFANLVERFGAPVFGIQHRIPDDQGQAKCLRLVSRSVQNVFCLSDEMTTFLRANFEVENAVTLPCPPSKANYYVPNLSSSTRRAIGALPHHVVFGIVGEAREGKGIELLLSALSHLDNHTREHLYLFFAGRAMSVNPDDVRSRLAHHRITARVDLRTDPNSYAVLTSAEYAAAVSASDVGVLLYQGPQRQLTSGVLYDFVWQNKIVLATRDSFVGTQVAKNDLGYTLADESPTELAQLIASIVKIAKEDKQKSDSYLKFRQNHSPESARNTLKAYLEERVVY